MIEDQLNVMEIRDRSEIAPKTLSILMVEDTPSDVFMVENMLKDVLPDFYLYAVDVPRLADAFKIIERESFDVILLDLNLLDIQGVATIAALHAEVPDTPIIVYSGMDDPKLSKEALMLGADYYCVKGRENAHSLKNIIQQVISRKSA